MKCLLALVLVPPLLLLCACVAVEATEQTAPHDCLQSQTENVVSSLPLSIHSAQLHELERAEDETYSMREYWLSRGEREERLVRAAAAAAAVRFVQELADSCLSQWSQTEDEAYSALFENETSEEEAWKAARETLWLRMLSPVKVRLVHSFGQPSLSLQP
jgi:hypothetical protein